MPQDIDHLTFVLTLAVSDTGRDDHDLERARLMFKSFFKFFDQQTLEEFVVVTPDAQRNEIRSALASSFGEGQFRVLPESTICPELVDDPDTTNEWPKPNKGWFRQQLIKLAMHEHVETEFYMTVDSDVIFTNPFSSGSLFVDGRALLNVQNADDFRQLYRDDIANKSVDVRRYRSTRIEQILKCSRPERFQNRWYGETPVLFSREVMRLLASHLEKTWQRPWRQVLLDNLPWTEHALYFEFAECADLLEKKYYPGHMDTLASLSNSLWHSRDEYREPRCLTNWNVDRAFDRTSDSIAVVVQSYLGYSISDIAEKVTHYATDSRKTHDQSSRKTRRY